MWNKATRSPEISREQVQKLTPQFLLYIYWIYIPTVPYNLLSGETSIFFFNVENSIKREMRKNRFSKKKKSTPPPPPPRNFFLHQFFIYFLMLEIAWNAKKTWNIEKKKLILLFSIFKKFIKSSNNIPSISKTIQHTPMTWCTYLQSFEKIHQCVFELQCEN